MRSPLLRFLALGGTLFALQWLWQRQADGVVSSTIVVAPGAADVVDAEVDDEVLFREAQNRGIDRDRVVRSRLVRLGRFLGLGGVDGSDERVEREARAIGLHQSDPVVRRHLIEMMRITAAQLAPNDRPSEAELTSYYEQHRERFAQPARTRFTHVYLSADRRGAAVAADAVLLLVSLRQGGSASSDAIRSGDPFVRGADLTLTAAQMDESFGPSFAAALRDLPVGTWAGPVRSAYGEHLVLIEQRIASIPAPYAAVRARILHELLRERRQARLRDTLKTLRTHYDVRLSNVIEAG